jgi:NAD(P)-dependent dehydrogenase (short-subunit alcohol dehydrogenase family)
MSGSKVLLVLGAGGNIGASVASLFAEKGYKVAIAARRLKDGVNDAGQLQVQMDLSKPETVDATFDKVTAKFGGPPNVIVYNGKSTFTPTPCSKY